jgi:hypothetical protein
MKCCEHDSQFPVFVSRLGKARLIGLSTTGHNSPRSKKSLQCWPSQYGWFGSGGGRYPRVLTADRLAEISVETGNAAYERRAFLFGPIPLKPD